MVTTKFHVNNLATGQTKSNTWVTITEITGGTLNSKVNQSNNIMGSLFGMFFNVRDKNILGTFSVNAISNDIYIDDPSNQSGNRTNKRKSQLKNYGYDVAIVIGEKGIGRKDVSSYSFTLSSNRRELSIGDISNIQLDYSETGITPALELIANASIDGFTWVWLR